MKYVKTFAVMAIFAALTLGFVACREKAPKDTETPKDTEVTIEFEEKTVQLAPGESLVLKVKVTPESEASKVVWESSNPKTATVDNQGKLLSQSFGTTEIKATLGSSTAVCNLAVTLDGKPFDLNEKLCLQYVWDYKANKKITYKGDKPAIIDFWATWCVPCVAFDPTLKKIAMEYEGRIYVFKANVSRDDSEGEPILNAIGDAPNDPGIYIPPYGTVSLPSFLLLPVDGSAPKAIIGPDEALLRSFIESELAKVP